MSETPRTDAEIDDANFDVRSKFADFARLLERELSASQARVKELEAQLALRTHQLKQAQESESW